MCRAFADLAMELIDMPPIPVRRAPISSACAPPTACNCAPPTGGRKEFRAARWPASGPRRIHREIFRGIGELLARGFAVAPFRLARAGVVAARCCATAQGPCSSLERLPARSRRSSSAICSTPDCPKPWFALAHSMGASALLDYAAPPSTPRPSSGSSPSRR